MAISINLSKEEVARLNVIRKNDQLITKMFSDHSFFKKLNDFLSIIGNGPISLVIEWNDVILEGWLIANKNLKHINKLNTCSELTLLISDYPNNSLFYEKLRQIRQCD